jgi:Holliday junction resolvase
MASNYGYGRRKELQVGELLERSGFLWGRAQGSRGPVDLIAKKGRRAVAIQVKSTRKDYVDYCAQISPRQETSLIRSSAARRASAVVALVSRNTVTFVSGRSVIGEARLKPLRYDYPGCQ